MTTQGKAGDPGKAEQPPRRGGKNPGEDKLLNVPRAFWSLLYLALEESLVARSGLLHIFHDYLRTAVCARYLPAKHKQRQAYLSLAGYFERREPNTRQVDELPWQLA